MTDSAIPIIDIDPFRHGGAAAVVAAVAAAARDIGFFVVTGHGVNAATTDRLYSAARGFFDLPDADKQALVAEAMGQPGRPAADVLHEFIAGLGSFGGR